VDRTDSSPPASRSTSPPTADGDKPSDKVIVDPTKGGAVNPKAAEQSKALQVQLGAWPWEGLVKILQVDLYSPAWEARHGAAMALRDILRSQGHCGGMKGTLEVLDS
jgi:TATA-binding protein-associated factor